MNKKMMIFVVSIITLIAISLITYTFSKKGPDLKQKELQATVLSMEGKELKVQDNNSIIYTFKAEDIEVEVGSNIVIRYTGILDKTKEKQSCEVISYQVTPVINEKNNIPKDWQDNGIFKNYYKIAYNQLKKMTLDEKIGQIILARYPGNKGVEHTKQYHLGGYVFFEKDFKDKTEEEVKRMMSDLQNASKIPLLTAVDEEGGKVVRISSNPNLVKEKFKSSRELYLTNGLDDIKKDTIEKSKILSNLGINLNLAPVVDVSTNPSDYMYERSLGQSTEITSKFAQTVIETSKKYKVSYTLKHFPGYGNNPDTHTGGSTDNRSYQDILTNDIPPFEAGIKVGAEAILVSHNTVTSIDSNNPASLSPSVHNLLRNDLNFTGIIITDDLAMGAVSSKNDAIIQAILAGNDLIITTDYVGDIDKIKKAISNKTISEELINKLAFRVIAWKYYKGLMFENGK